mmetsp:Transcript_9950/g.25708  ORF Transcript_9950/g.25708 Transcript_9950/m.25708 type:complete len:94 (-) Transcript_9950:215-496(-)
MVVKLDDVYTSSKGMHTVREIPRGDDLGKALVEQGRFEEEEDTTAVLRQVFEEVGYVLDIVRRDRNGEHFVRGVLRQNQAWVSSVTPRTSLRA